MGKSSEPAGQHFFPKTFLKGFTNENGKMFMYDSQTRKIIGPTSILNIAKKRHLYTVVEGGESSFVVEKLFSQIEGDMASLLDNIRLQGFQEVDHDGISDLVRWVVFLFNRTPSAVSIAEDVSEELPDLPEFSRLDDDSAQLFLEKYKNNPGRTYADFLNFVMKSRYENFVKYYDIILYTSLTGGFVLNDRYLCAEGRKEDVVYKGVNVDWEKTLVKFHFPVSSSHCISFVPKSRSESLGTRDMEVTMMSIDANYLEFINNTMFRSCDRYVYAPSKNLLDTLASL